MKIGCEVDLVTNGAEAVIRAREKFYDLILMDCHMPEMDGFVSKPFNPAGLKRVLREWSGRERSPRISTANPEPERMP